MIDLLFVIINSAITFAVLIYVFKKYGLPFLKRQHTQEILHTQNLQQALSQAEQRISNLEVARIKQEEEFAALQESVLLWRKQIQEQTVRRQNELTDYALAAKAKQVKQTQNYQHEQIIEAVKPLVLKELTEKAHAYMHDAAHKQAYTSKALQAFKRVKA
jgi:hypothetical protein